MPICCSPDEADECQSYSQAVAICNGFCVEQVQLLRTETEKQFVFMWQELQKLLKEHVDSTGRSNTFDMENEGSTDEYQGAETAVIKPVLEPSEKAQLEAGPNNGSSAAANDTTNCDSDLRESAKPSAVPSKSKGATATTSSIDVEITTPAMSETVHVEEQRQHVYVFSSSTWDASFFVGLPQAGMTSSLISVFALLLTIVLQMAMIAIVLFTLAEDPLDDENMEGLRRWRRDVAHNVKYLDPISKASMVARLCQADASLETFTYQLDLFKELRQYAPGIIDEDITGIGSFFSGPLLCVMALVLWLCACLIELRESVEFGFAGHRFLKRGHKGHSRLALHGGSSSDYLFSFQQVSPWRIYCLFLVCFMRVFIAGVLCITGALFLLQTIRMEDLLLNSMALSFVLDVDEMFYAAFVPRIIKTMVTRTAPLKFSKSEPFQYLGALLGHGNAQSIATFVMLLASSVACSTTIVRVYDQVTEAQKIMCGGDKDWVFTTMFPAGGVEYAASIKYNPARDVSNYRQSAMVAITEGRCVEIWATKVPLHKLETDITLSDQDLMIAWGCQDYLDAYRVSNLKDYKDFFHQYSTILSNIFKKDITRCSQVLDKCSDPGREYAAVRALCAVSCGCMDPVTGLFFSKPVYGCPSSCTGYWKMKYREDLSVVTSKPCQDASVEELAVDTRWHNYWTSYDAYWRQQNLENAMSTMQFLSTAIGCKMTDFFNYRGRNACDQSWEGQTLAHWCPISCNCGQFPSHGCPVTCVAKATHAIFQAPKGMPVQLQLCGSLSDSEDKTNVPACPLSSGGSIAGLTKSCCDSIMWLENDGFFSNKVLPRDAKNGLCCFPGCLEKYMATPGIREYWISGNYDLTLICESKTLPNNSMISPPESC